MPTWAVLIFIVLLVAVMYYLLGGFGRKRQHRKPALNNNNSGFDEPVVVQHVQVHKTTHYHHHHFPSGVTVNSQEAGPTGSAEATTGATEPAAPPILSAGQEKEPEFAPACQDCVLGVAPPYNLPPYISAIGVCDRSGAWIFSGLNLTPQTTVQFDSSGNLDGTGPGVCNVEFVSSSVVVLHNAARIVPLAVAGLVTVHVTNPDGQSFSFHYDPVTPQNSTCRMVLSKSTITETGYNASMRNRDGIVYYLSFGAVAQTGTTTAATGSWSVSVVVQRDGVLDLAAQDEPIRLVVRDTVRGSLAPTTILARTVMGIAFFSIPGSQHEKCIQAFSDSLLDVYDKPIATPEISF